jgi:hypothetical protein
MVAGVIGWVRAGTRERDRPSPPLSWWAVVAAAAVLAAVVWGATAWLLREAGSAKDPAAARVEAIKTGLGIGAGTGGVFALLLAVRRQWHQERSSAATELDAAERRVTELYTKAADQLGSDKAPVRLAGLYALERVAQYNEKHRQTIVNMLCAYLRMPYQVPGDPPAEAADKEVWAAHRELIQEREVRLAAQRILTNHLQPGENTNKPVPTFWKAIDLNLIGATLIDLSLFKCVMRDARFRSATFIGGVSFGYATVSGYAVFDSAIFDGAAEFMSASLQYGGFGSSTFRGVAEFRSASFGAAAEFGSSTFQGAANFREATFAGMASFKSASFTGDVDFSSASFEFVLSSSEYAALMMPGPGLVGRYSLSLKLATFTKEPPTSSEPPSPGMLTWSQRPSSEERQMRWCDSYLLVISVRSSRCQRTTHRMTQRLITPVSRRSQYFDAPESKPGSARPVGAAHQSEKPLPRRARVDHFWPQPSQHRLSQPRYLPRLQLRRH